MYNLIHKYSNETDYFSQTCINTEGKFICGCNSGLLLDIDGTACNSMQKQFVAFIHTYNMSNLKYILRYIINAHSYIRTDIHIMYNYIILVFTY